MRIDAFKEYVTVINVYEFDIRFTMYGKRLAIWRDADRWPRTIFEVWKAPIIDALYDALDIGGVKDKSIKVKVRGKEHEKEGTTYNGQAYSLTVVTVDSWRLL